MERGKALEPQARAFYAFHADADVRQVGFIGRRVSMADIQDPEAIHVGCSPDGLVGDDGGLELKVPLEHTHISYLALDGDADRLHPAGAGMLVGDPARVVGVYVLRARAPSRADSRRAGPEVSGRT